MGAFMKAQGPESGWEGFSGKPSRFTSLLGAASGPFIRATFILEIVWECSLI
jgi:hypothetical protein